MVKDMIKLENKRLMACAELIMSDGCKDRHAADIGTDHGYLAAYLVQSGICLTAVAADINEKPLESAKRTIAEQGLEGSVTALLSDGLDSVPRGEITHIICAGMGGELIADILSRCEWAKECTLILQPMTKPGELREWLFDHGFAVNRELARRDGRFVYSVMRAKFSPEGVPYEKDELYLNAGLIDPGEEDGAEYIRIAAERLKRAGEGILSADSGSAEGRRRIQVAEKLLSRIGGQL